MREHALFHLFKSGQIDQFLDSICNVGRLVQLRTHLQYFFKEDPLYVQSQKYVLADLHSLDSPVFDLCPRLKLFELDAQSVHVESLLLDFDDEEVHSFVVVEHSACGADALVIFVFHGHGAGDWCQLVDTSPYDLLLNHLTLCVKVVEDAQREHILDPSLAIITDLPLQLEDGFEVNLVLNLDLLEVFAIEERKD